MKNLVTVFILLMLITSCNPAKKLARQQKQYMAVVDEYNKNHPVRIDTTTKYIHGNTITTVVERTDTVAIKQTDTITGVTTEKYFYEKGKDIYHYTTDTVVKLIVSTGEIELLKKLNENLTAEKNKALLISEQKNKWFWLFIIACIISVVLFATTLKKTFSK